MVIRRIALVLGLLAAMVTAAIVLLWLNAEAVLDQPSRADKLAPSLLLAASNGQVFAARGGAGGAVNLDLLPRSLTDAVVAIEDRRFYSHHGIDLRGLLRAARADLSAGAVREGGSTITQQLVKLDYLTSERSFARKFREIFLALALERRLTKQQILSRYLARVYLGAGVYGVEAASLRYFGKPARSLTLPESAMIAGLIRAPSSNAPTGNLAAAQARAGQVLQAMVEAGTINEAAAAAARSHPAVPVTGGDGTIGANYFADWVVADLPDPPPEEGILRTTLDPQLQALAEASVHKIFASRGRKEGFSETAMVVMTTDGAVKAMVGGRSYAESQFNRATSARRQPGSAFKPFVYLAALEAGVATPGMLVTDAPISINGWSPQNFTGRYLGEITLETAFAQSINTVAAQLAARTGPQRVVDTAHRLGIRSPLAPNPSIALGTSEVSLLELTTAYAVFANHGRMVRPYGAFTAAPAQPAAADGKQDRLAQPGEAVIDPRLDDTMLRLMTGVIETGSGRGARFNRPAAGKTGTSQDYRDAWFIGFTADLVVGVWVGNDDDSPTRRVTGGGAPAAIWRDFMTTAYATGRFGNERRPLVAPAPPAAVAAIQPGGPDEPYFQPSGTFMGQIGRGLGSIADSVLSIFR
jgi:penicillin-binding protein 1A